MGLFDEALMQYDELEALFHQTLAGNSLCPWYWRGVEQGAPWFPAFGGCDPQDDSADILNIKKKAYRELIVQNNITIFDFRVYLFARQCHLLFRTHQPVAICQRAFQFITAFGQNLLDYQVSFVPFFTQSWIYSACMNVIAHADELIAVSKQDHATHVNYGNSKGALFRLALQQVSLYYEYLDLVVVGVAGCACSGCTRPIPG